MGRTPLRRGQRLARDEEVPTAEAREGEHRSFADRLRPKRQAAARLRRPETEEAGSGSGPTSTGRRPRDLSRSGASFKSSLAGREAALWLAAESLTVEHAGEPLSRYDVKVEPDTGALRSVGRPRLFDTPCALPQPRLFALDALGEGGWLKAMRLEGYAPRSPRRPKGLQQALFAHHKAWG